MGIKPIIEYLVLNPEALHISMVAFTIIEAIVGLFLILGLFTRIMSVGVFFLAMGILLGSGWICTTCLDEWQIGVLGIASGFVLFLTGSSTYSLDHYLMKNDFAITRNKWFSLISSGELNIPNLAPKVLLGSMFIFGMTLFTNQYFHGGVWGTLHNKSVRPKVEISNIHHTENKLTFQLYRVEGADVYGSFLIGIEILDENKQVVKSFNQQDLATLSEDQIKNHYVAKIKPGKHSMIIPLGAKADVTMDINDIRIGGIYSLKLIDISGIEWIASI